MINFDIYEITKMRIILLLLAIAGFTSNAFAQEPCATKVTPADRIWLDTRDHSVRNYYSRSAADILYIPVQLHIVGDDNGNGYFKKENAYQLICELNAHFVPVGIVFFMSAPILYHNNTSYYIHNWTSGYQMMDQLNVVNNCNIYVVSDPAGACGYAYYPGGGPGPGSRGGIALAKSCSKPGNSTLAHEVGHYLSLPHTFDQWDSNPEYVNGSNCASAGDYFCDTPADFIDYRWYCPYGGTTLDPVGDPYNPDGSFFMSYSIEPCGNRFSGEQISAMQYSRVNDRPDLDNVTVPNLTPIDQSQLISPPDSSLQLNPAWVTFTWNSVPNATEYFVLATPYNSFVFTNSNTVRSFTTDTTLTVHNLSPNLHYRWKVIPLNQYNNCINFDSSNQVIYTFETGVATSTDPMIESGSVRVYPNPSQTGKNILIQFSAVQGGVGSLDIYSTDGRLKKSVSIGIVPGDQELEIPVSNFDCGIYLVNLKVDGQTINRKLVLTQ